MAERTSFDQWNRNGGTSAKLRCDGPPAKLFFKQGGLTSFRVQNRLFLPESIFSSKFVPNASAPHSCSSGVMSLAVADIAFESLPSSALPHTISVAPRISSPSAPNTCQRLDPPETAKLARISSPLPRTRTHPSPHLSAYKEFAGR